MRPLRLRLSDPRPLHREAMRILIGPSRYVITLSDRGVLRDAFVLVEDGRIAYVGRERPEGDFDLRIGARRHAVLPGFIQTHVHLIQTSMRNMADDLSLLDWLKLRIMPAEGRIGEEAAYWSSLAGALELLKGGTTTIFDFGAVRNLESILSAAWDSGIRAFVGKMFMDNSEFSPEELIQGTGDGIRELDSLLSKWHGKGGRIWLAATPRFALSSTEESLREVLRAARERGLLIQTHASENPDEVRLVRERTGKWNVEYLMDLGYKGHDVSLVHCIHLRDEEYRMLAETGTHVVHCPSANLKLASGIARVWKMIKMGINVSIGADGPPCNNNLDALREMRLASLLQKVVEMDSTALPAGEALKMGTVAGARMLNQEALLGTLEEGKLADIVVMSLDGVAIAPLTSRVDPVAAIVYSASSADVEHVFVGGVPRVLGGRLLGVDEAEVSRRAAEALEDLHQSLS